MEMTYKLTNGIRLASICRICLRSGQCLHPVIDSVVPNFHAPPIAVIQLWKIFDELLLSHGPNFPDSICGDCLNTIQSHYLFMLKCEKADALLKGVNQLNSPLTRFHRNIQNPTHSKSDPKKQCKDPHPIGKHSEERIRRQLRLASQATSKCKRIRKDATISRRKRELLRRLILRSSFRKIQSNLKKSRKDIKMRHSRKQGFIQCKGNKTKKKMRTTNVVRLNGKPRKGRISRKPKSENNDFVLTPLQSTSAPTSEVIKPEPAAVVDSSGDAKSQNQTPHFVKYINRDGKVIKVWECGICSRNFQHQYTLMRHLPTHTNVRNFVCNECGKAFRQLSTLSQHRAIHSVERPYACETCNKSFNRISTLISHRKTHSDVKPFRCHMCHKGFHQKGNLRNHIYIHTNERPYRCTVCNKGFNQMSNLVCHTQKSHSSEFGSIWTCDRCNMSFSKRTLLRAHELETHHIQGTNIKSTRPKLANNRKSATTTSDDSTTDLDAGNEFCKSEISENGILIPAIDTDAMKIARANKEMPFAVLHFFEGPPLLVRIVDYGNQSLLRPTKNEDFISLKNQQAEQIEKVCVPIVAAVYQTLNVAGRPEFKVMPPKNIYKFINHHQSISLNCDNNNEGEREASKPDEIIPAANIISLTPPQIPSDLRDVTENLETPLFESLTHVKDEPSNMDENSMEFNPGASMGEKPRAIAIVEESNWWKRHTKADPYEEVDAFSETFQNIATGSLLTPKKITESDIMPDQNASILDLSEARNPLLCHGQQISNNNNDNIFNYNSLMNYDFGNNISNILDAFRSEGMDASMIKSLFSENPGLLHDFNECLSEILP